MRTLEAVIAIVVGVLIIPLGFFAIGWYFQLGLEMTGLDGPLPGMGYWIAWVFSPVVIILYIIGLFK